MAANRYAEMVRWMAWPRIKNSRSSAQPGTHPHDGVQATVTPAPDAEPPPGTGQNAGVGGTRRTVAHDPGGYGYGPGTNDQAAGLPRAAPRLRPIRYAHSGTGPTAAPAVPVATGGSVPPPPAAEISDAATADSELPGTVLSGTVLPGPVLSGTVLPGPGPAGEEPEDYDGTAGLVYEAPRPAYSEPPGPVPSAEPDEPVPNEGLGIFGGVATTEVPDDDAPARDFGRLSRRPAERAADRRAPADAGDTGRGDVEPADNFPRAAGGTAGGEEADSVLADARDPAGRPAGGRRPATGERA